MQHNLLDFYQAIEESSRKMLDAAKAEDWDAMVRCEGSCAALIEQLRIHARTGELDANSRREKSRIMLRILQNDAQIRYLVDPKLDHCVSFLKENRTLH